MAQEHRDRLREIERLLEAGEWPEAVEISSEIVKATDTGDPDHPVSLRHRAYAMSQMGRFKESTENYMRALDMAEESGDTELEANILKGIGFNYWQTAEHGPAMEFYERALFLLQKRKNRKLEGELLIDMANVHNTAGRLEQAVNVYQGAVKILTDMAPSPQLVRAYHNLGDALIKLGRLDEAVETLEGAVDLGHDIGGGNVEAWGRCLLALALVKKGEIDDAREHVELARTVLERTNDRPGLSQAILISGMIHAGKGDFGKALDEIDRAVAIAVECGYTGLKAELLLEKGHVLVRKGDKVGAKRTFEVVRDIWMGTGNAVGVSEVDEAIARMQ